MTAVQSTPRVQKAGCVLTVRLTFPSRVDAEDAIDMMEHCIVDALAIENSIEEL